MSKKNSEPVSYGYQKISLKKARTLVDAWLDKSLPQNQWQIVAPTLRSRKIPDVVTPVIEIIKKLRLRRPGLLDVGCSSGFYYDFFELAGLNFKYAGCDISPDFISLARKKHRGVDFKVAPITELPYKDNHFEVVLASGVLHLELSYEQAVKELVRVSSRYVLLHRLPIFAINTRIGYYQKVGYGVKMMERVFSLSSLSKLFFDLGLLMKFYLWGDKLDIKTWACWTTILLEKRLR